MGSSMSNKPLKLGHYIVGIELINIASFLDYIKHKGWVSNGD